MSSPDEEEVDAPEKAPNGLINAAGEDDASAADPQAIIAGLEGQMDPAIREDYDKIVAAGMQWGMDKGLDGLLASLQQSQDPVRDSAVGAVNAVFKYLSAVSRGTLPPVAGVWASQTLMLLALDFAQRAGFAQIGPKEIDRAFRLWSNGIFTAFSITPEMLNKGKERTNEILANPAKMEQLQLAIGARKDPRASMPLDMPAMVEEPAAPPMNRRARRAAARAGRG